MKNLVVLLIFQLNGLLVFSQDQNNIINTPARSGTSYEALTEFFQANITSQKGGGYDFKATLFGIQKFFSKDSLNASSIYLKKYIARNLEFTLGIHKNSNDNLSLLRGGIKYALVNNRDKSTNNFSLAENGGLQKDIKLILVARNEALNSYTKEISGNSTLEKELEAADIRFKKSQDFNEYPKRVQLLYNQFITSQGRDPEEFLQSVQNVYDRIAKNIEKKSLLTVGFYPAYDWNQSKFDSTVLEVQYLKGFGNFKKPWNIDIKASQLFMQDTLTINKSLSRKIFVAKLGINKVLVYDGKLNPLIEFELAYEHDIIFDGLYSNEEKNRPKMVSTLRVHISKEVFIPLTLKYDLKNSNLFGIFRLQWDLQRGK